MRRPRSSLPVIIFHVASSRSVSSPGSTTAPWGSLAMVASSVAVAGIEPVEPAAITGPVPAARRFASASISLSRRSAGSMRPRSSSTAGQYSRAIFRNRSVFCQYSSRSVGHETIEPSHDTCRVIMSSISRARSSASASAAAGLLATSERSPSPRISGLAAHCRISSASRILRSNPPSGSGRSSVAPAASPIAASAKAISSSSTSPIGTMRGRIAASLLRTSRKIARQPARAPRRQIERRASERERIGAGPEAQAQPVLASTPRSASAGTASRPEL